ncbi:MAG: hypothetical protein ABIB97_02390 [Patescibacteria group bacterium]
MPEKPEQQLVNPDELTGEQTPTDQNELTEEQRKSIGKVMNYLQNEGYSRAIFQVKPILRELDPALHKEFGLNLAWLFGGAPLFNNLKHFDENDHPDFIRALIESKHGETVPANIDKFRGTDHRAAFSLLIEEIKSNPAKAKQIAMAIEDNLEKFQGLDSEEAATNLIGVGQGGVVLRNLEKFPGLNHKDTALKIIEAGKAGVGESANIIGYFDNFNFQESDHPEIANALLEAGLGAELGVIIDKFSGLDQETIDKATGSWEEKSRDWDEQKKKDFKRYFRA